MVSQSRPDLCKARIEEFERVVPCSHAAWTIEWSKALEQSSDVRVTITRKTVFFLEVISSHANSWLKDHDLFQINTKKFC